jgi:hypothetical protein
MADSANFLLREILDELLETSNSLVGCLFKLKYFGISTNNEQLIDYTNKELNGYKRADAIPEYRQVPAEIRVDLQVGYNTLHNKIVPVHFLEPPYNEMLKNIPIHDSIDTLERIDLETKDLVRSADEYMYKPLSYVVYPFLQKATSMLYHTDFPAQVVDARSAFNKARINSILREVRGKLIDFTVDVGRTFGYDIHLATFKKNQNENNQTIINIMNNNISNQGDANVVNTGDHATQHVTITIQKGDVKKLREVLSEKGIDDADIIEIEEIVQHEKPDYEKKRLGEKSIGWITKIAGKALAGVGKVASSVTSAVLAEYLKNYYGL